MESPFGIVGLASGVCWDNLYAYVQFSCNDSIGPRVESHLICCFDGFGNGFLSVLGSYFGGALDIQGIETYENVVVLDIGRFLSPLLNCLHVQCSLSKVP